MSNADMDGLRELVRRAGVQERSRALASGLAERAASRGLLDVSYSFADSPFGTLLVATTRAGLVRLAYPNEGADSVLQRLATDLSPRILESSRRTESVRRELDEYFERRRRRFQIAVDLS